MAFYHLEADLHREAQAKAQGRAGGGAPTPVRPLSELQGALKEMNRRRGYEE